MLRKILPDFWRPDFSFEKTRNKKENSSNKNKEKKKSENEIYMVTTLL